MSPVLTLTADKLIRTWEESGFRLELYETNGYRCGKEILAYRLYDRDKLIFEGDEYGVSPMHSSDGNESVSALLAFLTLRKGDTDSDYFDDYTPEQIEWRDGWRCEYLQAIQCDMENGEYPWKEED